MSKHTDAINILRDEVDRMVQNILHTQKQIGNIEEHLKKGAQFPAMHEYQSMRLRRSLKEQVKTANNLTASIKALEAIN